MHGNTFTSPNGFKTRVLSDIQDEIESFFQVHEAEGTVAGGLHLELTGKNVIECIGDTKENNYENLGREQYETLCDPRLNRRQAITHSRCTSLGSFALPKRETIRRFRNRGRWISDVIIEQLGLRPRLNQRSNTADAAFGSPNRSR